MSLCDTCNFNNSANSKTDIMITQLKKEVSDLVKNTNSRLLLQDGKIAETCVYIKENLSNELRILFDSLQNSGELGDIITETVLAEVKNLENIVYPLGHIRRYGATGDGIIDDTLALSKAAAAARTNNIPLIVDDGKYLITSNIDAKNIKVVNIAGEIISNNDSVLEIGGRSSDGSGMFVTIQKAKIVKISGVKNSIFNIGHCEKLHLFADGADANIASLSYCQFYGAYCKEILIESTETENVNNIGWINENVFRIKRVESITIKGNYDHNNNHFEHINFERGVLNLENARNNYFSARSEGGITVNSSAGSQANFVEKEYYYKHYFGNEVSEDENGTLIFQPVNKLQTETELMRIDKGNKHYPIGTLLFKENGLFNGVNFNEIFRSNLIKIDKSFALILKSDAANFRVQMRFYDENKNLITSEVDNFSDGRIVYIPGQEWPYAATANTNSFITNFYPGEAKFVEYHVIFGSDYAADIEYVSLKLLKYTNTNIHITNLVKNDVYRQVPTQGYFEQGTILYANSPAANTSIGIVCVQSGTPGVWKNWGAISS